MNKDNYPDNMPREFKPIRPWGYVGYLWLFALPLVGFIVAIIFATDDSNINRRNLARGFLWNILIGLIFVILILILSASILLSVGGTITGEDVTNRAKVAVFSNNFSEYYDRITIDALGTKQKVGVRSEIVNDAQLYYMVANGLEKSTEDCEVANRKLPVGYVMPDTIAQLYNLKTDEDKKNVVAYVIDDNNIIGYNQRGNNTDGSAGYEFYGDSNGEEYHFVTSSGHVFTLPGFAFECDDRTVQYYISNEKGCYYVTAGKSKKAIGDTNINGDVIKESGPIDAKKVMKELYGLTEDGTSLDSYHNLTTTSLSEGDTNLKDEVGTRVGRYTVIK